MPESITKNRHAAFKRQGGLCYYCEFPMWLKEPTDFVEDSSAKEVYSRLQCTAEHLVARQDGGGNSSNNIVAACIFCNKTRHRISSPPSPQEYRKHVERRLQAGKWHPKKIWYLMASLV